jgi:hypothetical protein
MFYRTFATLAPLDTISKRLESMSVTSSMTNLTAAQTGAVGDAERSLVLGAGTWRILEQLGDLIWGKDPGQWVRAS